MLHVLKNCSNLVSFSRSLKPANFFTFCILYYTVHYFLFIKYIFLHFHLIRIFVVLEMINNISIYFNGEI